MALPAQRAITLIKVWVKLENNEPEKIEIRADSDIDDLKNELFLNKKEEKRQFYGIYNGMKVPSSAPVPLDTTGTNPVIFLRINDTLPQIPLNDVDTLLTTATQLNTAPLDRMVTVEIPTVTSAPVPAKRTHHVKEPTTPIVAETHLPPHFVETIHYKNGDKYVGEVNDKGEPHGKGTMTWKNGRRYEGDWKNGKKDGSGIEYGANGAVNFMGDWKNDVLVSSPDNRVL